MSALDLAVLLAYVAVLVGAMIMVRPARSMNDYALGGRAFPATIVFASLASTAVGPGFTTGLMGKAADAGLIWVLIFCFFSVQMLLTGIFLAPRLRSFDGAATLGDIIGVRYGLLAKVTTGIIAVLFSVGIVGAIAKTTGSLLHVLLGVDTTAAIVVSTFIVIAYSAIGGLKADVLTDVLQFAILAMGIPLALLIELPEVSTVAHLDFVMSWNPTGMDLMAFSSLATSFLLGELLLPPYATRALSARTPKAARRAFVLAACFSGIWFLCIGVLGRVAATVAPSVHPEEVFFTLVRDQLPGGVSGLVVAALAAIIASSQDSFLNCASVAVTRDVIQPLKGSSRSSIVATKITCALVGVMGMISALLMPSIVDALLMAYSLWVPTIVAPLIAALLSPRVLPVSGILGMLSGGAVALLWSLVLAEPFGIPGVLPGLAASIAGILIGLMVPPRVSSHPLLLPISILPLSQK